MVGSIPFTALHNDSRISYTLYVPPQHYNPDPDRRLQGQADLDPKYLLPTLPLIVNIHGSRRGAEKCRDRLIKFADAERVAVLAPLFPAGIDGYTDLDSYKMLKSKTLRSDLALLQILDEVAAKWPGIETQKFFLMGFSGGGQFAHRFAYLYPERLQGLSVGAPGRATFLSENLPWPSGIQNVTTIFGENLVVQKEKIKAIGKIQLVVGARDNTLYGGKDFWAWLGTQKKLRPEGSSEDIPSEKRELEQPKLLRKGRLDLLRELQDAWRVEGILSQLDIVPDVAHDSGGVHAEVEAFLRPLVRDLSRVSL